MQGRKTRQIILDKRVFFSAYLLNGQCRAIDNCSMIFTDFHLLIYLAGVWDWFKAKGVIVI
jgi:hypothetical protein